MFTIAALLIGVVCGNLGAVVAPPVNLGLWWNSVFGAVGAAGYLWLPDLAGYASFGYWVHDFIAAGAAGFALVAVLGTLVALWSRRLD